MINYSCEILLIINIVFALILRFFRFNSYRFDYAIIISIGIDMLIKYNTIDFKFSILYLFKYIILASYVFLTYTHRYASFYENILAQLSLIGSTLVLSVYDIFQLFLALELSISPTYILIYMNQSKKLPKYIIFGMLSSALVAFGISLIYFATGTMNLFDINMMLHIFPSVISKLGILILLFGMCTKLAFIPFHGWFLHVFSLKRYEIWMAFIAIISKITVALIAIKLFPLAFSSVDIRTTVTVITATSILCASICAVREKDVKQFFVYISIEHLALIISCISCLSETALKGVIIFLTSEILSFLGLFSMLTCVKHNSVNELTKVCHLRGLFTQNQNLAIAISCLLLSLSGIPPFFGFWGKYNILIALAESQNYTLVITCIISMIFSGIYTINILKNIWSNSNVAFSIDHRSSAILTLAAITIIASLFVNSEYVTSLVRRSIF